MATSGISSSLQDQMVKGAAPPSTTLHHVAVSAFANPPIHDANDRLTALKTPPYPPSDPTSLLPSAPPQIYLNLLILEASLRSQYLTLRARRRQNTFVLTLLAVWILFFFYLLWLRPRDDGKGIGGSKYWLVDMSQKVCFITGVVTALLFWATGQWERGVRWPRRWIGVANRGLRGMNAKIVIIRGPWWRELANWLAFVMPFSGGLWGGETGGSSYHFINLNQEKKNHLGSGMPRDRIVENGKEYAEEDIAPGGDYIMLLLLPKPFTPDFREGWEIYRTEYWERENERRSELRKRVRARQREIAREEGGWLWWTGWRGWKRARGIAGRHADVEKISHAHHQHHLSATNSLKDRKRRPSHLRGRESSLSMSHSRSSSRSTTPTPDLDDRLRPMEGRERRWSNSTTGSTTTTRSDSRRKKPSVAAPSAQAQVARQPSSRLASSGSSRPSTPVESHSWQSKRASALSTAESLSEYDGEAQGGAGSMGPPPRPKGTRRGSSDQGVETNAPSA